MKYRWLVVAVVALATIFIAYVVFFTNALNIGVLKIFGVARENVRRDIFEESKSYVHGKIQDLARYYEQYMRGDQETRKSIAEVIKITFAAFDADKIPDARLRNFLRDVRGY